jgi:glycosyltransferase involved in cell wall biosynthesis
MKNRVDNRDSHQQPRLSVVLPVHNEGENLRDIIHRIITATETVDDNFEIVCVNDGSRDASAQILDAEAARDSRINAYHLSRNFGHMAALTAGLHLAKASSAVICLDADGQHPPELIPAMVKIWRNGADLVQMIRIRTEGDTAFKRWSSTFFYLFINLLSDTKIPDGAADFRLMSREVVDALNSLEERERFTRGLVQWIGFDVEYISFTAPPRQQGNSNYGITAMLAFAFSGITSFSVQPLRMASITGLVVICVAFVYSLYVLGMYAMGAKLISGWSSMILLTAFLNGMVLFALGIIGEYLAHLYIETKRRPVFIVRNSPSSKRHGGTKAQDPSPLKPNRASSDLSESADA